MYSFTNNYSVFKEDTRKFPPGSERSLKTILNVGTIVVPEISFKILFNFLNRIQSNHFSNRVLNKHYVIQT